MTWHTGRTVGVTLYQGDGPDDMVGVMTGSPDQARLRARGVVASVNGIERLANWIMANVPGEPSRSEGAVDVAIRLLGERAAQDGRWRALVGELRKYAWHWPMCESDDGCTCGYRALDDAAQAALDGAPE